MNKRKEIGNVGNVFVDILDKINPCTIGLCLHQ